MKNTVLRKLFLKAAFAVTIYSSSIFSASAPSSSVDNTSSQTNQNQELKITTADMKFIAADMTSIINKPILIAFVSSTEMRVLKIANQTEVDLLKGNNLRQKFKAGQLILGNPVPDYEHIFYIVPIDSYFILVGQIINSITMKAEYRPIEWDPINNLFLLSRNVIQKTSAGFDIASSPELAKFTFVKRTNTGESGYLIRKAGNLLTDKDLPNEGFLKVINAGEQFSLIVDRNPEVSTYEKVDSQSASNLILQTLDGSFFESILNIDVTKMSIPDYKKILIYANNMLSLAHQNSLESLHNEIMISLNKFLCDENNNPKISSTMITEMLSVKKNQSDTISWLELILNNLLGLGASSEIWKFTLSDKAKSATQNLYNVFVDNAKKQSIVTQKDLLSDPIKKKIGDANSYESFVSVLRVIAQPSNWFLDTYDINDLMLDEAKTQESANLLNDLASKLESFVQDQVKNNNITPESAANANKLRNQVGVLVSNLISQILMRKAYESFELMEGIEIIAKKATEAGLLDTKLLQSISSRNLEARKFNNTPLQEKVAQTGFKMISLYNNLQKLTLVAPPPPAKKTPVVDNKPATNNKPVIKNTTEGKSFQDLFNTNVKSDYTRDFSTEAINFS